MVKKRAKSVLYRQARGFWRGKGDGALPAPSDVTLPEWDPAEIAAGTADAAFVSDERGLIVGWNEAAETLLGYRAEDVLGRPCYEVLCGRDAFGNQFCDSECAISKMAQRGEPAHQFMLAVRPEAGRRLPVRVSVLRLPLGEPSRFLVVHVLFPSSMPSVLASETAPRHEAQPVPIAHHEPSASEQEKIRALTPREAEVLRLLAAGNASQEVASELFISLTTVRTHVRNILRKLDVHSQLEAVALAFRSGLV